MIGTSNSSSLIINSSDEQRNDSEQPVNGSEKRKMPTQQR
jgi:hypothetical protein